MTDRETTSKKTQSSGAVASYERPYGAFEQKRLYQRYLLFGVGVTNLLVLSLLLLVSTLIEQPEAQVEPVPPLIDGGEYHPFDSLITIIPDRPTIAAPPHIVKPPEAGEYTPIEDSVISVDEPSIVDETSDIPDIVHGEWFDSADSRTGGVPGANAGGTGADPDPDDHIFPDVFPAFVLVVKPAYPPLARRAGIEGVVWVRVLIGERGFVSDVIISKASGSHAGFEDAALESARKCRFSPAIKAGKAIKMWVTFPFEFRLMR